MRRVICWAASVIVVSLASAVAPVVTSIGPAAAVADTTPVLCPGGQGLVSATFPAYARQSAAVSVGLSVKNPAHVINVSVAVLQGPAVVSLTPVTLSAGQTQLSVHAPATGGDVTLLVLWDQGVGTLSACAGSAFQTIPLLSPDASAGDPSQPRLTGSFGVIERPVTPRGPSTRATWEFSSACVYFACGAYLQSSTGTAIALNLSSAGVYHGIQRYSSAETATSCTPASPGAAKLKNAYTSRENVYLHATQASSDTVTAIAGTLVATYTPTPTARRLGCSRSMKMIQAVSGQAA